MRQLGTSCPILKCRLLKILSQSRTSTAVRSPRHSSKSKRRRRPKRGLRRQAGKRAGKLDGSARMTIQEQLARKAELLERIAMMRNHLGRAPAGASEDCVDTTEREMT